MKKHSQLVNRIVRPYLILLTVILSIAVAAVYSSFVSRLKYETETAGIKIAETTARQIDTFIEELDMLAEQVKHQPRITGAFYDINRPDNKAGNLFDNDVLLGIDISSALKGLITDRTGNYNISIYNAYGDFISSQNFMIDKEQFAAVMQRINYDEELKRIEENGENIITSPQKNPWTGSEKQFVTLKKCLKNDYSDTVCGIIEVRASVDRLSQMLRTDDESEPLIFDRSNGSVIYPSVYEQQKSGGYVSALVNNANWEVMIHTASASAKINVVHILLVFVLIYILLLSFLFIISGVIGKSVTKPISQLASYVRGINAPDDKIERVNEDAIDEIKELEDNFEKMLARMNNSITKEKKAYALALQAQMNPHFLYNMLAVISSAGIEGGCENISNMCVELSDMLRYVAAYQKVTVPLKEEITHTKNYLSLMKLRYEDLFAYNLEAVDEELMNIPVPKLIIQPLAENCFIHAFKEKEPPWNIDISLTGTKDKWQLIIKDNGSGISEKKIAEIKNTVSEALSDSTMGGIGDLGIANTIVRLTMVYDGKLFYEIYNDNGMCIKIIAGE